jgi:hypothetical protein
MTKREKRYVLATPALNKIGCVIFLIHRSFLKKDSLTNLTHNAYNARTFTYKQAVHLLENDFNNELSPPLWCRVKNYVSTWVICDVATARRCHKLNYPLYLNEREYETFPNKTGR